MQNNLIDKIFDSEAIKAQIESVKGGITRDLRVQRNSQNYSRGFRQLPDKLQKPPKTSCFKWFSLVRVTGVEPAAS